MAMIVPAHESKPLLVFGDTVAVKPATSTTSLETVGAGVVSFIIQPSLPYKATDRLRAASASSPDWMEGAVSSYEGENLALAVDKSNGTGTHSDWNITQVGATATATGPVVFGTPAETKRGEVSTFETVLQIPRRGAVTIAMVFTKEIKDGSTWNAVALPKDAEILDLVEVYRAPGSTGPSVLVFPNEGETIGTDEYVTTGDGGAAFRKVTTSLWLVK